MKLKAVKFPQSTKEIIANPIPQSVIFKKPGKGDLNYISITYVTDTLNAAFGPLGWSWENKKMWVKESETFFRKNSKYYTADARIEVENDALEKGSYHAQPPVVHVEGRLTVRLWDEEKECYVESYREACGSKVLVGAAGEQESAYKSAQSDAMKKAASFFGVGLELARKDPEKEYFEEISAEPLVLVWTEELKAKYEMEWSIIESIVECNEWTMGDFGYYVHLATEGIYKDIDYMPEELMASLMDTLKAEGLIADEEEQE